MDVVSPDVAFATARLEGFNKATIRLETNGATQATPNSIVTINLPSNCTVDMQSWLVHLDIACQSGNAYDPVANSSSTVFSRLPADTSSLFSQLEVYAGGVQIAQGFSEFHTVSKVKKLLNSSRDRDNSIDKTLYHGEIDSGDTNEVVTVAFKPLIGLFGECSTRYWPLSVLGDVTVRLTLASNAVLAYKVNSVAMGTELTPLQQTTAAGLSYTVTNIHSTIDTVSLGEMYESMLLARLREEPFIACNFKEYYTFNQHGTLTEDHDVRFALSASSIDRVYAVCRYGNYQTPGVVPRSYPAVSGGDALCSNFFYFSSFNDPGVMGEFKDKGTFKYQWQVNNVQRPQFRADIIDAAHETLMVSDYQGLRANGNMITSLADYQQGKAIIPLQLCKPGESVAVASGYNSRGNNSHCSLSLQGQTGLAADSAAQIPDNMSTLIIVETTAQLRISGQKQIIPVY